MKDLIVTAKLKNSDPVQVTVQCPETLEEAIKVYGEEAILSNAIANWKITLQGNIRSGIKKNESPEVMQTRLGDSKMGVAAQKTTVDAEMAFMMKYRAASPEERKAMIQRLKAEV